MSWRHIDEEELDSRLPLLGDLEVRASRDDGRAVGSSPAMSIMSTQSYEVKHILEPSAGYGDREADTGADYSHIHIKPKPRPSDGGFLVRPPPPAYHRPEGNHSGHFHQPFLQGGLGNVQRFRSPPQTLSLEDVSNYELSRRKSWSPPLLRQNVTAYHSGQKTVRSCYSSNMVDWETPPQGPLGANPPAYLQGAPHGYWQGHHLQSHLQGHLQSHVPGHADSHGGRSDAAESLPPRLAPVSGVPPEKVSRNLIRPIAFKPAYTRPPPPKICPQCREDLSCCICTSCPTSQNSSQYQYASQTVSCQPLSVDGLFPRPSSVRSVDQSSVHSAGHGSHRSAGYGSETVYLVDDSPGVNVDYSPPRKASAAGSEVAGQTPSPSDSGVGELEAMLKEREAEILTLRQVMDRNERAIFQVYEEKRSQWLADMQQIREDYEQKLKAQQLKATQLEQALAMQVQRLQKEKPSLLLEKNHTQQDKGHEKTHSQQDKAHTLHEKSHTLQDKAQAPQDRGQQERPDTQQEKGPGPGNYANLQKEAAAKGVPPEDDSEVPEADGLASSSSSKILLSPASGAPQGVQEEMAMKNTEILGLRAQLQTLQAQLKQKDDQLTDSTRQVEAKAEELRMVHEQLDQLSGVDGVSICEESTQTVVVNLDDEISIHRPAGMSDEDYTQSLERQIGALRQQLRTAEAVVESERLQWLEEKNKVIRYQKQLQLNYIQMQQKNKALEAEVEQLTLELESRHLKLAALNGEESVC